MPTQTDLLQPSFHASSGIETGNGIGPGRFQLLAFGKATWLLHMGVRVYTLLRHPAFTEVRVYLVRTPLLVQRYMCTLLGHPSVTEVRVYLVRTPFWYRGTCVPS